MQKCRLRRLISENTRKTTSDMALFPSRKMENISRKGMLYMKTLANNCLKSFQLKQHLNNAHKKQPSKIDWAGYSKSKEGCIKRVRLDAGRALKQANLSVEASHLVALRIAKAKKSWDFAELVQPCLRNCAKIVLDDRACNRLKQVSPSNDTIKISTNNPRSKMLVKWKHSRKAH